MFARCFIGRWYGFVHKNFTFLLYCMPSDAFWQVGLVTLYCFVLLVKSFVSFGGTVVVLLLKEVVIILTPKYLLKITKDDRGGKSMGLFHEGTTVM